MTATSIMNRLLAFVAVVVALVVGVFALGRISDNATLSMGLTAVWFGVVFVVAGALVFRRRELFWPLAVGYAIVAVAAAVLIIAPTLFDKEVNERVVTGTPASAAPAVNDAPGTDRPRGNVELAAGSFVSIAHSGTGRAAVVELPSGERKVTLTDFETDSGPDLRLYVSTGDPATGDLGDFEDLGALKGNIGNQQYTLPQSVDIDRYSTVVVWCRAFSVGFTSAALERS
jgi:Electron transfer DM13